MARDCENERVKPSNGEREREGPSNSKRESERDRKRA